MINQLKKEQRNNGTRTKENANAKKIDIIIIERNQAIRRQRVNVLHPPTGNSNGSE